MNTFKYITISQDFLCFYNTLTPLLGFDHFNSKPYSNIIFCDIFVEENSLSITREIREEDVMYSIVNYASENEDTLNLVEGEKVYVVGKLMTIMNI